MGQWTMPASTSLSLIHILPTGQDGGKLQLFGGFQRRKRVPADIKGAVQRASCRASGLPRGMAGSGIDGPQRRHIQLSLRCQGTRCV